MIRGVAKDSAFIASYGQMKTHLSQPTHFSVSYTALREYLTTFNALSSKPSCFRTFLLSWNLRVLIFVPSFILQKASSHCMDTILLMPEFKALNTKSVGILPEQGTRNGK